MLEVKNLGDRALFLGCNTSLSINKSSRFFMHTGVFFFCFFFKKATKIGIFIVHKGHDQSTLAIPSFCFQEKCSKINSFSYFVSKTHFLMFGNQGRLYIHFRGSYQGVQMNKKVLKVPGIEQKVKRFPLIFFAYLGFQNFD